MALWYTWSMSHEHPGNESPHASSRPRAPGPRCVLWVPAGQEPPRELIASLERRGLRWTVAQDGYEAIADMLLRIGKAGPQSAVLVLVHPTQLDLSGLVVDSLERYGGPVAVWRFDPSTQPVLGKAQRPELATVFTRTERVSVRPRPRPQPAAQTAPPRPMPATPINPTGGGEADEEPTAASLLSDEELSMLLAEKPR